MQLAALLDPSLRAGRSGRGARRQAAPDARGPRARDDAGARTRSSRRISTSPRSAARLQGVAAASRGLFDRDPHGLGEAESALLAALLRAPNAAADAVAARACRIAARRPSGASCAEIAARGAQVFASAPVVRPRATLAPHLAARLLRDAAPARVATTLDASLQRVVAEVLASPGRGAAGPQRARRRRAGRRQRERRRARLRRRQRRAVERPLRRRRARAAPGRVEPQAVPLRARLRPQADHRGDAPRRRAARRRHRARLLSPARTTTAPSSVRSSRARRWRRRATSPRCGCSRW